MGVAPYLGLHSFSLPAPTSQLELAGVFLSTVGKGDWHLALAKKYWDDF